MEIIKGRVKQPPRIIIFGIGGLGKSTLASKFPNPIFIDTENRLAHINCEHGPTCSKYEEVLEQLAWIDKQEHNYKTLVIDSLDWLDSLIQKHTAEQLGIKTLADAGYGKGYAAAFSKWEDLLNGINRLRLKKNMIVIGIAHALIKRFESPITESYDRYTINLRENVADRLSQWCDCLFFGNYKIRVKEGSDDIKRGVTTGERVLYTKETPAYKAKDSYGFADEIPMDANVIIDGLNKFYGTTEKKEDKQK